MKLLNTNQFSNLSLVKGEGCWVWDGDGARYLDLLAGTWSNVLGHCHPKFTGRIQSQLDRLVHVGSREITPEIHMALEYLDTILPEELNQVTFLSTGSEAVELAIKIARIATGRPEIVSFRQGYYGATNQALALSEIRDQADYLDSLKSGQIDRIPAPTCFHCPLGVTFPQCEYQCLTSWQEDMASRDHSQVAAILFEPVIAGPMVVPPPGYLKKVAGVAAEWGCLTIAEEVTTGLGRTGRWFGFQHDDMIPDLLVLGKALGNGLPVAAVITSERIAQTCQGRLVHIQSHQNDPLSGAAAATVIEILQEDDLVEHVRKMGMYFLDNLSWLQQEWEGISSVRGIGLMSALELAGKGSAERGLKMQSFLKERGVLLDYKPTTSTFRFFPPYVISRGHIDFVIRTLMESLRATEYLTAG